MYDKKLKAKKGKVLMLGMTNVTKREAKIALLNSKIGVSSSIYRDWLRLRQMEKHGYQVIGLSYGAEDAVVTHSNSLSDSKSSANHFIQGPIGKTSVKALNFIIKKQSLDYIFADYFRMPGPAYFDMLGKPFLNKMLYGLIEEGAVDENTQIVLPHYRNYGTPSFYDIFLSGKQNGCPAQVRFIKAEEYPLWAITAELVDKEGRLDGHHHLQEIYGKHKYDRLFDRERPFMVISYSLQTIEKIKNRNCKQ